MNTRTLARSYELERKIFIFSIIASCVLVASYAYLLISTVATIALREEASLSIRTLSSEVSALEASYLSRKQGVTEELVASLGFSSVAHPVYITRTPLSTVALSGR
jgi:hypothetical protein